MPTGNSLKTPAVSERPEEFGPALAHVIHIDGGQDVVLGQAWLAGPNKLVTCGHVVDRFADTANQLWVHFLATGNRYQVRGLRLHPSFVHHPNQIVHYDAAVLFVNLGYPERDVNPLPIAYNKSLSAQQQLSAIRYPIHLGQLPNPLAQQGRLNGPLRKQDNFHLLHDLALAPGDSGAPIFDATTVVAIHCGDTATLPGLNLPTTAIRLALLVDALRELDIAENYLPPEPHPLHSVVPVVLGMMISFIVVFGCASAFILNPLVNQWKIEQPGILPIVISFNRPLHGYKYLEEATITLRPQSSCFLWLFCVDEDKKQVLQLYPPILSEAYVLAGDHRTIDRPGGMLVRTTKEKGKLHLLALNSNNSPLRDTDYVKKSQEAGLLSIDGAQLEALLRNQASKDPNNIYAILEAPTSVEDAPAKVK